MSERPTLETVAARAGVSRSLVSLVLQDSPKVSAASREAVLAAVAELNYRPNTAARNLAARRSHTVGLLQNDIRQPWFSDLIDGLAPVLESKGLQLVLDAGRLDRESDAQPLLDLGVDGLVVGGWKAPSPSLTAAIGRVPTVAVGGLAVVLPRVDVVTIDDAEGVRLAVAHLTDLGHTRIAHVAGTSQPEQARRAAFVQVMSAAGREVRTEDGDLTEDGGHRAGRALLAGPDRPTAIVAPNDVAATGVLSAALDLGLRVPDDLSLVGFDNSSLARLRALSLTSVDTAGEEMGREAARMLLERMTAPATGARTVILPARLVVRRSTAAPPPS